MDDTDLSSEQELNNIPALPLVADADNADALRRQLIFPPALPVAPTPDIPDPEPPPDADVLLTLNRPSLKLPILTMKSEAHTTN